MTVALRVTLIVASILTLVFIARKVRSSQVKLEDSIFWFVLRFDFSCEYFSGSFLCVVGHRRNDGACKFRLSLFYFHPFDPEL